MRVIETKMCDAIQAGKDWKLDNTEVINIDGVSEVYLFGKLIAKVDDTTIVLYDGGHRTTTTKSRLNAILSRFGHNFDAIFQKKFEWFFHDSARSVDVPFFSGLVVS